MKLSPLCAPLAAVLLACPSNEAAAGQVLDAAQVAGPVASQASSSEARPSRTPASAAATTTLAAPSAQEAGPRRKPQQEPDPEAVQRGERALRDILVAAGSRPNLPGAWNDHLLWYDVEGLRYDSLEILRTRLLRPGAKWRLNHFEPRFFFGNGEGRGYLLRELAAPATMQGEYRAAFRREVGAGDVYWAEFDGQSLRSNEEACLNAQKFMLGEYFFGYMPHSLTLFDPSLVYLRNERLDGRPHEVYRLQLPGPFLAEWGHASDVFTVFVDPASNRITELRFPDPLHDGVSVIVHYSNWQPVEVPERQLNAFKERLTGTIEGQREVLGDDGVEALVGLLDDPEGGLLPTRLLLPSRRAVRDDRGGRDREFLCADFQFEPLPEEALERPWQTGRVWISPWRSDFFDSDPTEGAGGERGADGRGGDREERDGSGR